jgi:hypothetical protein
MSVDLSKIRPGDEVLASMRVNSLYGGSVYGTFVGEHDYTKSRLIPPEAIISHATKTLVVGDRVLYPRLGLGVILAIDGDFVWLLNDGGARFTVRLTSLERAP